MTANNVRDSTGETVLLLLYYYYYAWLHCKYLTVYVATVCEKLSFAGCADKTTFFVIKWAIIIYFKHVESTFLCNLLY